jgi:hypothetical protein
VSAVIATTESARHHVGRGPRGHLGFSWARFKLQGGVTYRLFRRDVHGKLYGVSETFDFHTERTHIAAAVRRMRNSFRDRVDAIVLQQLGVAE